MKIGSHVSMSGKDMLLGSVKEALSYGSNTFMFYTGAPQNTTRKPVDQLKVEEAKQLMQENNIDINDVVVHAPYIINLANTVKPETFELAVSFLKQEISRCNQIGVKRLVLHPGAHVGAGSQVGIQRIVEGLDVAMEECGDLFIALETMAGKGTEIGRELSELKYIIENAKYGDNIGVCLDTCHLHDSGVDLTSFNEYLDEFDHIIGLDKLLVLHLNDSKNALGAKKDRHENIGYGHIGFETLLDIVYNERIKDVPKILETPYIDKCAPYKVEIDMLKQKTFQDHKQ